MKYGLLLKISTIMTIIFNFGVLHAHEAVPKVSDEDLVNIQTLINKNLLKSNGEVLILNEELLRRELLEVKESSSTTNCTGGGGGI